MNEIMEKTYELIDVLDDSDIIKNIGLYKKKMLEDESVCDLIKEGNLESDMWKVREIRVKLYENDNYRMYMEEYNKLFYIVMKINDGFKRFTDTRKCFKI